MRLRWHGCPGEVTFVSVSQGVQDCGLDPDDRAPTDGIRFVECSCYETINTPDTFDPSACQPLATTLVLTSSYGIDSDICIVSVEELDGGAALIDLSKPLPQVIGLVHSPLSDEEEDYTSQYWNPYPLRTYFDTTCDIIDEETAPFVLPLFPGYGKIPDSCPSNGFIDLWEDDTPRLPDDINHTDGELSTELFWYEFVDGTSTGFWPTGEEGDSAVWFNPTFAVCACNDCGGVPSTPSPPSSNPGAAVSGLPPSSPIELTPSPVAVESPSASPMAASPTNSPTANPTNPSPTASPTTSPTKAPTASPTGTPTAAPTPAPTGAVVGTVFEDTNNNGQQDPGEPGIPNVDVVITDKNGDTQTLTTDSDGEYSTTVPAGSTVTDIAESTLPSGGVQTVGTDPTAVDVPADGVATDLDGYYFPTEAPTESPVIVPTAPECFVIDFETDGQGADLVLDRNDNDSGYVENEWNNYCGVVLSAEGGVRSLPRLFDSANPLLDPSKPKGCGDSDLGAPNENCPDGGPGIGDGGKPGKEGENCVPLGLILIVQEEKSNGVLNNCPDDKVGGNMTFDFGEYVEDVSFEALDVEEAGNDPSRKANTRVEITYSDNTLKVYELEPFGDNSKQEYVVPPNEDDGNDQIKKVKVDFTGSGGIPSISFCCKKD